MVKIDAKAKEAMVIRIKARFEINSEEIKEPGSPTSNTIKIVVNIKTTSKREVYIKPNKLIKITEKTN